MKDFYSFARKSIGLSHIKSQKPCQDYVATFENDDASVIVVSDGHGSSNFTRSDRGSRFACEVSVDAARAFLEDLNPDDLECKELRDSIVMQLCRYILLRWNLLVDQDALIDPFTEAEVEKVSDKYKQRYLNGESVEHAYGCTLILVILTQNFCLAIRNGDGECVTVDRDGCFTTPIPWNEKCELNVTTSLCDSHAIDDFRYFYSTALPAAIFIGSDGVDDSYASVDELYNLYRHICLKALNDGTDAAAEHVERLLPEITKRGSTDDVSIAGLINPEALQAAQTTMEIAIELRQAQLAEEKRQRQKRILIADIQRAEKKKNKAISQLQDVRQKLQGMQASQTSILEQISFFRRKADACIEGMSSLAQDEKQLADIIDGADSEIARLRSELLALEGETEAINMADSRVPLTVEPAEKAVLKIDGLSDCDEPVAVEPETEDAPIKQDTEGESAVQDVPADPE